MNTLDNKHGLDACRLVAIASGQGLGSSLSEATSFAIGVGGLNEMALIMGFSNHGLQDCDLAWGRRESMSCQAFRLSLEQIKSPLNLESLAPEPNS